MFSVVIPKSVQEISTHSGCYHIFTSPGFQVCIVWLMRSNLLDHMQDSNVFEGSRYHVCMITCGIPHLFHCSQSHNINIMSHKELNLCLVYKNLHGYHILDQMLQVFTNTFFSPPQKVLFDGHESFNMHRVQVSDWKPCCLPEISQRQLDVDDHVYSACFGLVYHFYDECSSNIPQHIFCSRSMKKSVCCAGWAHKSENQQSGHA